MKHYTGSGDSGQTALLAGGRVPKQNLRVEAYGSVDELNSILGWAVSCLGPTDESRVALMRVQGELFELGSDLATPMESTPLKPIRRMAPGHVTRLEKDADSFGSHLSDLHSFVLPGGCEAASRLHVARAVARKVERRIASLASEENVNPDVLRYMNRLSSLLFVLARWQNKQAGNKESEWHPQ